MEFGMFKKLITGGVAALALGGAALTASTPAQAQFYYGGPAYHGGYYGPGYGYYRPVGYGYYGRPVGYYGHGYYGRPYGYYGRPYYRRRNNGAAVAAGFIGGLALGAIAAQASRPAYYRTCYTQPQRAVNSRGRVYIRNVRVCR
jgi:hypothetical protein